jgi:hypothetical protein
MKPDKHQKEQRRQAQLIRRNMITRVKPSAKVYKRENKKSFLQD